MTNKNYCILCGRVRNLTKHHSIPQKKFKDEKSVVFLCVQHHQDIENIKKAIEIMNREKRVMGVKRFREIMDSCRRIKLNKIEGRIDD